ncbi:MAG: DUF1704 domain-containing protein [Candidatus Moranbacteria bacterium]|nr:DUF1704 domain-containing protein [Candidatus Moranbacteria bacterium]
MSFEISAQSSQEKEVKAVDEQWYGRFEKIGSFQDYEYFEGEKKKRDEQKQIFLAEEIRNPVLDYPKLEKFDFANKEQELFALKRDILEHETNDVVRSAYIWKLNEKIAQLRMMKATLDGSDKKVARYSAFIYGIPDKQIFQYDLENIKNLIEEKNNSDDVRVLFAIRRLKDLINNIDTEKSGINNEILPVKKRILEYPFVEEKKFNAEEIRKEFEVALDELGIEGWEVVINENIKAISVSQEKKQVKVPEKRKMTSSRLGELIAHEIGTHVARREDGERSKLKLLGLGLDRYLNGEEGISTFAEQSLGGADDFAGFDGHFAISLAVGLDGEKRDFRDVFNILRDYYFINSKNKDIAKSWEDAKNSAWNRCVRTFRGTTCNTKGACLTRDIVYREGNIDTWMVVKGNFENSSKFSIGKYDAVNPRHAWILQQLAITGDDIE